MLNFRAGQFNYISNQWDEVELCGNLWVVAVVGWCQVVSHVPHFGLLNTHAFPSVILFPSKTHRGWLYTYCCTCKHIWLLYVIVAEQSHLKRNSFGSPWFEPPATVEQPVTLTLHSNRTWRRNPAKSNLLLDSIHGHTLAVYLATKKLIIGYTNLVGNQKNYSWSDVDMIGQLDLWLGGIRRIFLSTNPNDQPWELSSMVGRLGAPKFRSFFSVWRQTQDVWRNCVIYIFFSSRE